LKRSTGLIRLLTASAAFAGALAVAGCNTDDVTAVSARALRPLPPVLVAEIEKRNMPQESPILVRIFKEESELEVWKQNAEGKFALLKTYPICRWSGELGPKVKEGDRQAPEGFYNITPGQMNPNSNYYLAFNLGFPNTYDRANDRNGAFLMVHGDCSSSGCYAMTDEQIQEIYALGRDSFLGGQKSFQVQAYPFRMTPLNLARHRNSPNMAFWRMIKEGNDHFEVTRHEPQVDVCEKHYVFDARAPVNATPVVFRPRDKCPVYEVPENIVAAVKEKQDRDERAFADYAGRGVATVVVRTGSDGGMHPLFLAKLPDRPRPVIDFDNMGRDINKPTAPLPDDVNPPRPPNIDTTASFAATEPATAQPSTLQRWFGAGNGSTPAATSAASPQPAGVATAAPSANKNPVRQAALHPAPSNKPKPELKSPTSIAQAASHSQPPSRPESAAPPASPNLLVGAVPVVPSGTFEGRWGGMQ
jgi:murein L,D-transpeptidase YafK